MQVVFIDHCARLGGAEIFLSRLVPALEGVSSRVILGERGPLVERLSGRGVEVEVLQVPRRIGAFDRATRDPRAIVGAGTNIARGVVQLAARLKQLRPDLVQTNSTKSALYGGLAARVAGVPCICHVHDRISPDYFRPAAIRMIQWNLRSMATGLILHSRSVADTLGAASGLPTLMIPSITELAVSPSPRRDSSSPLTVGLVGRISRWKGQDLFLRAFARAFPVGPERAVIAGSPLFGEEQFSRELRTLAGTLGIDGRVTWLGFVDDIPAVLETLDVLVHTSLIPEPFGLAVAEGMTAGLPVLAANAGGPAEFIEHTRSGWLYEMGNETALVEGMRLLGGSSSLRRDIGRAAARKAHDFSGHQVAERVTEFYGRLLEGRARASR